MQNFDHYLYIFFSWFLEAELVRGRYRNTSFHVKWLSVWLGRQGPGMKMPGKLVTRSGKSSVDGSLPKGVVCVPGECPPKNFSYQVEKWLISWMLSQALSPDTSIFFF